MKQSIAYHKQECKLLAKLSSYFAIFCLLCYAFGMIKRLAMIGLGKMGGNMAKRLLQHGFEVVVYDQNPANIEALLSYGATTANSLQEAVALARDEGGCVVWLMVPAGEATQRVLLELESYLQESDIVIEGGNSQYQSSQEKAARLELRGIKMLDCGTSGGIWGLENGYCLMLGGCQRAFAQCEPIFAALAPENGYLYCGASGSGHYAKMVHNAIEYGMMQSYAEGFELLKAAPFDFDLPEVATLWNNGSVVRSWLLELLGRALTQEPDLGSIADFVQDSGEGRWAVESAMRFDVPAPIITLSLMQRFASRQPESFSAKVVAALRQQFGGHAVQRKS
jgi:6-phosphogluconate dehydrogenase